MESTALQIDLTQFCDPDKDNIRYAVHEPWVEGGFKYATDGRIIVRVPAPGEADSPPSGHGRRPKIYGIFPPVDGDWKPWPDVECCQNCEGGAMESCDKCGGDGRCNKCEYGAEHECGWCNDGYASCHVCTQPGGFPALFGKAEIALKYVWRISKLPNVLFLPAIKTDVPVRFRFDGEGVGAVMPLRDPHKK